MWMGESCRSKMPAALAAHWRCDPNMSLHMGWPVNNINIANFEREGSGQTAYVHLHAQQQREQAAYLS